MASNRILGSTRCISGAVYSYSAQVQVPTTPGGGTVEVANAEINEQILTALKALQTVLVPEFTYVGGYRNIPALQIPANITNYEVDIGFPVRIFNLTTTTNISVRLGSVQGDEISLTALTSPFTLNDLPAGMSFNTIFVTNPATTIINIGIFAMG